MSNNGIHLLDCTLRDGGYYNNWDFSRELVGEYLHAMQDIGVDFVEVGFRSAKDEGFKGGCAFSKDRFLSSLSLPHEIALAVMVNASELLASPEGVESAVNGLFSLKKDSPISMVRIAAHFREVESVLPGVGQLKKLGYDVSLNLMQIADRTIEEIRFVASKVNEWPVDVLYFADSMGGMDQAGVIGAIQAFRECWKGSIGIHAHDNMGRALDNSIAALDSGATWVDSTVLGMGRGAGNTRTEYLMLALEERIGRKVNIVQLLGLIKKHFQPLLIKYGWGSNPFYYLAGKHGVHPSYIQEMLADSRYQAEDVLAVIEHLKSTGGKKFNLSTLEAARQFFVGKPRGSWRPADRIENKDVLILGTGPGIQLHLNELESFVKSRTPFVIALNAQSSISEDLIDIRAACHPVRLLAESHLHLGLTQPLAIPASMLTSDVLSSFDGKELLDFGLSVRPGSFSFHDEYAEVPSSLVLAYALAIATSGKCKTIFLAGFDGFSADDPRRTETDLIFREYKMADGARQLLAITPTLYDLVTSSVYLLNK